MQSKSKKRKQLLNFPNDLLILILLPLKSIQTCKLVSKQWKNLINDPNFTSRYCRNGSMIILFDSTQLYYGLLSHDKKTVQNPKKIIPNPSYTFHRINLSVNRSRSHELLSGLSNGNMVCVKAARGFFHLRGLFTRLSRDERVVKNAPLHQHPESWIYYGFGYDRYDDDYKIVVVCDYHAEDSLKSKYNMNKFQDEENNYFFVYSYKNDCWNVFHGFPYAAYSWPCLSDGRCYSFNGILHSIVGVKGERARFGKRVIVTYDIHTRRFGKMLVPDDCMACDYAKVSECDGRLCYTYWLADQWVMEVRDNGGYWTKVVRIDKLTIKSFWTLNRLESAVLHKCRNGRKLGLLVSHGRLVWYDYSKNTLEIVDVHKAWLKQRQQKRTLMKLSNESS